MIIELNDHDADDEGHCDLMEMNISSSERIWVLDQIKRGESDDEKVTLLKL